MTLNLNSLEGMVFMSSIDDVNKGIELLLSDEFKFFPDKYNSGGVDPTHIFNNFCFELLSNNTNHKVLTKRIVTGSNQKRYKSVNNDDREYFINSILNSIYNSDKTVFNAFSSPLVLVESVSGRDVTDKNIASKILSLFSCKEINSLRKNFHFILFDSYKDGNSNDAVSILNKRLFVDNQPIESVMYCSGTSEECRIGTPVGLNLFKIFQRLFSNTVRYDDSENPIELTKSRYYIITNFVYLLAFYAGYLLIRQIENHQDQIDNPDSQMLPYFVYGGTPPGEVNSPFSSLSRSTLIHNTKITYSAMRTYISKAIVDENTAYDSDYDTVLNNLLRFMSGAETKSLSAKICEYASIDDFLNSCLPESRLFNSVVSLTKKVGFCSGDNAKARLVLENSAISCLVACFYKDNISFDDFIDEVYNSTGLLLGTLSNSERNTAITEQLSKAVRGIDINKILRENKEKVRMRMVELSLCVEYSDGISVIKNV